MNRQGRTRSIASFLVLLLAGAMSVACGGGGGDNVPQPGLSATWVPANQNPGAMTISMGAGSASGTNFTVPVQVTGIDNFFGAAFRVTYDPGSAIYTGFSQSGSVIEETGVTVLISATAGAAGEVLVNATRQQDLGGGHVPGVDVTTTSTLITLNFRATVATSGNTFGFSNQEVNTCEDPPGDTCSVIGGVTWSGGTMRAN
jgi:hypothetical protein